MQPLHDWTDAAHLLRAKAQDASPAGVRVAQPLRHVRERHASSDAALLNSAGLWRRSTEQRARRGSRRRQRRRHQALRHQQHHRRHVQAVQEGRQAVGDAHGMAADLPTAATGRGRVACLQHALCAHRHASRRACSDAGGRGWRRTCRTRRPSTALHSHTTCTSKLLPAGNSLVSSSTATNLMAAAAAGGGAAAARMQC